MDYGNDGMKDREIEEKFSAIVMAISTGHFNAARRVFETSLTNAANEKIDQAATIAEITGESLIANRIRNLRNSDSPR